ncbi:anti-phage protein KwaA [Paenibacillus sp. sgz5001063]|uniref:anti-phage protein KwaA n=1 Tax=Paenibacillus sp. sgz5001063 TaxID=3242474 RepID=UPI0036D2CD02
MRTWVKAVLFLSSVSPMFFILFVQNFNFEKVFGFSNARPSLFLINPIIEWTFLGFIVIPNLVLFIIMRRSTGNTPLSCTVNTIHTKSSEVLNYFATYVIPLLSFKTDKINDIIVFALLLIVLTIIYTHTNMFFINPVLILFRYRIIEINQSIILITKSDLRIGDTVEINSIDNKIYLGVKI